MRNAVNFVIGAAVGAAVGLAVHYLLGPSDEGSNSVDADTNGYGQAEDAPYRSRLDAALDAGRQAAAEREAELRASLREARRL